MSTASTIAIIVLVIVVIGLVVALAVTLSQSSSETKDSSQVTTKSSTSTTTSTSTSTTHKDEVSSELEERSSCMIDFNLEDGTKETVAIGEPWYLDQNNNKRCFAPAGQKCCEQIDLPSGEEGCMMDFTGFDATSIKNWIDDCIVPPTVIDTDKLSLVSTRFQGTWMGHKFDNGEDTGDEQTFEVAVSENGILKIKRNGTVFGLFEVKSVNVNPIKTITGVTQSNSGTTTTITIKEASENDEDVTGSNTTIQIVETPANTDQSQTTTYLVSQ